VQAHFAFAAPKFCFSLVFSDFGNAEITQHSEKKRKKGFPFAFRSFFRNFALYY